MNKFNYLFRRFIFTDDINYKLKLINQMKNIKFQLHQSKKLFKNHVQIIYELGLLKLEYVKT